MNIKAFLYYFLIRRKFIFILLFFSVSFLFLLQIDISSGNYCDSAHGDNSYGVNRSSVSSTGYTRGNCTHCHEQHTSIAGSEPTPVSGASSNFCLFAENFSSKTTGPYNQSDDFCFYCHINSGAEQSEGGIVNKQYSNTFGGYNVDSATDILNTFNLSTSYHNLNDIKNFAKSKFSFFKNDSNPCIACHNPHLAKRNKIYPDNPQYTPISRPTDHDNLWGDNTSERMSNYTTYRPPYYYGSTTTYEPNGSTLHNGSKMPDYNAFCLDCHQYQVPTSMTTSENPNTPSGYLTAIDWSSSGDMHGEKTRYFNIDGSDNPIKRTDSSLPPGSVTAPYNNSPVASNYVLSCLDCHEPHGTFFNSSFLLRKEVNGAAVPSIGPPGGEVVYQREFCKRCHTWNHCGGPNGCFFCHYHGAQNKGCAGPWSGANF